MCLYISIDIRDELDTGEMCLYISIDIRDELDTGQQESTDEINNGAFLSYQISTGHQPPLSCIFLLQQISTSH